jgi:hypothetical protein
MSTLFSHKVASGSLTMKFPYTTVQYPLLQGICPSFLNLKGDSNSAYWAQLSWGEPYIVSEHRD